MDRIPFRQPEPSGEISPRAAGRGRENQLLHTIVISLLLLALFFGLYLVDSGSPYHLLFHSVAEFFSIAVATGIFMISWNSRKFSENSFLVFLGIAFLYIGCLDLIHTLTYRGMQIFPNDNADTPTQFWISTRYLHALSFLAAPLFFRRKLPAAAVHAGYAAAVILIVLSIMVWRIFPSAYQEGTGLTAFKKISENIIMLIFAASLLPLFLLRKAFDGELLIMLTGSVLAAIVSEAMFTLYVNLTDIPMIIGHFMKVFSFYLLYRGIIVRSLWQPYGLLFRNIEERNEELARQKRLLENAIEALTHPFYIIDTKTRAVVRANSAALGLTKDGAQGTCHAMTDHGDLPCDSSGYPCPLDLVCSTRKPARVEHVHYDREGNPRYFEVYGYPILDADGSVFQMIEYSLDVTERRRALLDLEEKSKELARSNEDLRQFAYIASHDLQEPLRMVTSYVSLLAERYRGKLDPDADDFIRFAVDGAKRMRDLINGLLSFSRVGTHAKPSAPVDMNAVIRVTLSNLEVLLRESDARIDVEPLPPVLGDEMQIIQVFQNLISNAVKFRSREPVRVRIRAVPGKTMVEFSVEDNGIGIEEKYFGRIFQLFQRLHTREEYPGTGIGLTICRKIVERHGGTIRPVSEPGKGTTFLLTLPAA